GDGRWSGRRLGHRGRPAGVAVVERRRRPDVEQPARPHARAHRPVPQSRHLAAHGGEPEPLLPALDQRPGAGPVDGIQLGFGGCVSITVNGKNAMLDALDLASLSLHTGFPGSTGANEVTGGSYARQAVTFG